MTLHINTLNARPEVGRLLSEFCAGVRFCDLPSNVVEEAKLGIADTLAVSLAARHEPITAVMRQYLEGATGKARILHTGQFGSAQNAALANGAFAHALDFDDGNITTMIGHPSSPVVPAVLALADELGASGQDVITAYVVGHEMEGRLGSALTFEHNRRGWHTTCTLGTMGATAAAASMLKLDPGRFQNAIGIAASMASGLRQNFGYMTKPLHPGISAQNGVMAARLAQAGMESSPFAIEGHEGFLDLFTNPELLDFKHATTGFGETWDVLLCNRKLYPTCGQVHPSLDMITEAIASGEIVPADLDVIRISASFHTLNLMRYERPADVLQARFCIPFCVATALVTGDVTNADFTEKALQSEQIRSMMDKVDVYPHPDLATMEQFKALYTQGRAFTELEARHKSGAVYRSRQQVARGNHGFPVPAERWRRKFVQCAAVSVGDEAAGALWQAMMALDSTPWSAAASHLDV